MSKIYKCPNCEFTFSEEEIKKVNTTYESYYGVYSDFLSHNEMVLSTCPFCGEEISDDDIIKEHHDNDDDDGNYYDEYYDDDDEE